MTSGEDERLTAPCPASLPELSDQDAPFGRITKDSATPKAAREFENDLYSKDTDGTADLAVPLIEYPTLRLEPREARLLVLHPTENAAEHVRCSLETYAITELPTYVAIKNARGYRNFQEVIQVDEEALPISIALERFLRYFRTKIRQPTRIWVRYACVMEFNKQEQKAYWTREFSDFMYEQASEVLDMHETNSRLIESGYFLRIINVNSMKRSKEWYGVPDEVVLPRVCPIRLGTSPNSEAPTMDYQYMPIDMVADEIRIMCVMSAEDVHAPIVIHVAHCPINSEVHYIALSYRWGEDHSQEEVVMNGQKMAIRKNLAQAIRAIRLPDRILPIWIDALSINQKDVIERSRQVPRMGEIYDNAVMVYSYLGEPTEDIDSVFDFINELFNHPMVRTNKEKEFHFPSAKAVAGDDQPAENAIKPNRLAQLCAGLYRLLTRQYFRRAWMLQEVAYASNPLAMVSGRQAIRFDFVESAAHKLEDMLSRDLRLAGRMREADPSLGEIDINMLSYSRKLFYFRHLINHGIGLGVAFHRIGDESPGFLEALVVARDFESTDPTDKIFALWNLARDKCGLDFKPGYGKHYQEVYADFARAWIEQHHTLDIVGAVEATEQSRAFYDTTPSWTPNWSLAATTSCLIRKDYVPMTLMSCVKDQQGKMYCADGGITRNAFEEPLFYIENRTLHCTGLIVDQIGIILGDAPEIPKWAVFPPCDPASHWRFQCWVSEIEEYLRKHGSEVYDDPLQAAWAMLHGDNPAAWPHRAECDPDQIPTQDPYICKTALSRHVTYYVGGYLPHQAWNVVKNVLRGRRPFISDNGYMGLAPAYIAEQQDLHKNRSWHLAIVAGCSVPLVLGKEDDGTYRVVGTCFVQGWMEGEWMEKMMGADSSTEFWDAVKDGAKLAIS